MRPLRLRPAHIAPTGASVVVCALCLLSSYDVAAQPAQRADCTGSIDGHAVDAKSHDHVGGATVTIAGSIVATTDAEGHFAVSKLCAGEVTIEVERVDYTATRRTLTIGRGRRVLEVSLVERVVGSEVILIEAETEAADTRSKAVIAGEALERTRGRSFSDTLSDVPGVSQLRSASGMAKPIVRGQHGRRLPLLVDGTRHRSQDWGIDHAPEVDPFVADEIAVVRGAAGVRYGPDAIGGAVLAKPPALRRIPGVGGEAHVMGFLSNPQGGALSARVAAASARVPGLAGRIEGSLKRLAAPFTPDYALDNTSASEWNIGSALGYRADKNDYVLSFRHYQAMLGVCRCLRIESSEDFFAQLERDTPIDAALYQSKFGIERAFQDVAHSVAQARARFSLQNLGTLSATYALQYDKRREFDVVRDSTGPQFDFRLTTHDVDVAFEHRPIHLTNHRHLRGSLGVVAMAQVHRFGGLPLVPDHQAFGAGLFAIERLLGHNFELEAGARYDVLSRTASIDRQDFLRLVRSDQLDADACGAGNPDPVECDSTFHTVSASIGGLYQLSRPWSVKLNLSTAMRPPNPDEQYLNGTSPTFPVLGLGKPDLGSETTYSVSATTSYVGERFVAEASTYANYISDYIYFAPAIDANGDPIFDVLVRGSFPRFITRPVDAVFYGFDAGGSVRPVAGLELAGQVSAVRARNVTDDSFLVFVPPDRIRGSATYRFAEPGNDDSAFVSVGGTFVARQGRFDRVADLTSPPDGYFLLDGEIGGQVAAFGQTIKLSLQGKNLLNARYRDYTSLLRYFADQPGTHVMVRMSLHFDAN